METLNKMLDAIEFIEANMEQSVNIEQISKVACSSPFHFQRMFHMITGFTVAEYIRNRKLTLAAQEFAVNPKAKVIDISLKYGYDSPESFSKAFRKAHGITPTEARNLGVKLKAFPRISFHLSLKGEKDMNYKLVEKESFKVIGKAFKISFKDDEHNMNIADIWEQCQADGTVEKISALDSKQNLLGITMDFEDENKQMTYMIGIEDVNHIKNTEFDEREIPASAWAVFTSEGALPQAIISVWSRIFQEWFPATGYEHANAPELEVYLPGDFYSSDYKCEVWTPIVKKQ